jgi:hypothetical protein
MKQKSTLFLKLALLILGIPVLALCVFVVPQIGNFAAELYPDMVFLKYLVMIGLYATAIPFYFALVQSFKLLSYIDKNKAFSELSITALKKIKYSAFTISLLYVLGLPLFLLIGQKDDAPGVVLIGLIMIFASMVVGIFAAVLQKLLKEAVEIKSENDLIV